MDRFINFETLIALAVLGVVAYAAYFVIFSGLWVLALPMLLLTLIIWT